MATYDNSPMTVSDPQLASRSSRFWARVLDQAVFWVPLLILSTVTVWVTPPTDLSRAVDVVCMALTALSIPSQWYLIATRGQTIGKILLGIRIVDGDGNHPGWTHTLLAREGARLALGFVPTFGALLGLLDTLMVFSDHRRTWHDQAAGTYVVRATEQDSGFEDRRLSQVRPVLQAASPGGGPLLARAQSPASRVSPVVIAAIAMAAIVCGVGSTAAIAIPNFITMQLKAKRGEVPNYVEGIRAAEVAYHGVHGTYLPVGSRDLALSDNPGKALRPWSGGPDWDQLGWAPDGQVRGAYWVDATDEEFVVTGFCDVDGDGIPAVYQASTSDPAWRSSDPTVY